MHKCCTHQRRTPIKKSQVMNFRIEFALYIASLMPVVSVVPAYAGMSVYAGSLNVRVWSCRNTKFSV